MPAFDRYLEVARKWQIWAWRCPRTFASDSLLARDATIAPMEHDDEALTAAGWTVRRFERRSGAQAGGRYQTWQPPAGGRAMPRPV